MVKLNGLARSHSEKTVAEPSVNMMVSTLSLSWINWLYFLSLCHLQGHSKHVELCFDTFETWLFYQVLIYSTCTICRNSQNCSL